VAGLVPAIPVIQGGGHRGELTFGMMWMVSAFNPYDTLPVADEALEKGGVELLRAGLADKRLFVSLRRHALEKPEQWGEVLAEMTLNIAMLYAAEGEAGENEMIGAVAAGYRDWLRAYLEQAGRPAGKTARKMPVKKAKPTAKPTAKAPVKTPAKALPRSAATSKVLAKTATKTPTKAPAKAKSASKAAAARKGAR
jgi:hypothetical protein